MVADGDLICSLDGLVGLGGIVVEAGNTGCDPPCFNERRIGRLVIIAEPACLPGKRVGIDHVVSPGRRGARGAVEESVVIVVAQRGVSGVLVHDGKGAGIEGAIPDADGRWVGIPVDVEVAAVPGAVAEGPGDVGLTRQQKNAAPVVEAVRVILVGGIAADAGAVELAARTVSQPLSSRM